MASMRGAAAAHLLRRLTGAQHRALQSTARAGKSCYHTTSRCDSVLPLRFRSLAAVSTDFQGPLAWMGVRHMYSDISLVPEVSDPQAKHALNSLLATNWNNIERPVHEVVQAAIAKGGADADILSTAYSTARASESFAQTLTALRMALDDLSGADGESVARVPEMLLQALDSAVTKYTTYLEEFSDNEDFLKKKVQNDIGGLLIQLKQRCSVLDPRWSKITLIGTSGISGSYIERRYTKVE